MFKIWKMEKEAIKKAQVKGIMEMENLDVMVWEKMAHKGNGAFRKCGFVCVVYL